MFSILLFICAINDSSQPVIIYVVRHAEKQADQADPDLSEKGHERIRKLNRLLREIELDGVISSQFLRTRRTAEPIASMHQLPVEIIAAEDQAKLVDRLESPGKTLLVVGHSNTIPQIIQALGCSCSPIDDQDYDNLFVLILTADTCRSQKLRFYVD